jgi:hypothetical protein
VGVAEPTRGDSVPELTTYVAECAAYGLGEDDLRDLHVALELTSARLSAAGQQVFCLRSSYLPDVERWAAVFVAEDPEVVRHVAHIAQLSSVSVHPVIELGPSGDGQAEVFGHRAPVERRSS